MLPLCEDFSFVWEPAEIGAKSGKGRKISVENLVVGQKVLISKRVCIMGRVNFFEEATENFWRKLHNCSVINLKHALHKT